MSPPEPPISFSLGGQGRGNPLGGTCNLNQLRPGRRRSDAGQAGWERKALEIVHCGAPKPDRPPAAAAAAALEAAAAAQADSEVGKVTLQGANGFLGPVRSSPPAASRARSRQCSRSCCDGRQALCITGVRSWFTRGWAPDDGGGAAGRLRAAGDRRRALRPRRRRQAARSRRRRHRRDTGGRGRQAPPPLRFIATHQ